MTEVEKIARGLSEAQRKMMLTGDDHDTSAEEYRFMFTSGIMARNGQYQLSDFGKAVRQYLQEQSQ